MITIEKTKINRFTEIINKSDKVLIITHVNPDGDTIGASLGMAAVLKTMGKKVTVVSPDPLPDFLDWLPGANEILVHSTDSEGIKSLFADFPLMLCMDFNAPHRTGDMENLLTGFNGSKVLIDHHLFPDENFFDLMFSFPQVSSTCELLYILLMESGLDDYIRKDVATSIFVGIMTDTGSFAHSCNHKEVFEITAALIEKGGLNVKQIHDLVYNNYEEKRLRFLGYCISEKLVVKQQRKAAYIWVTLDDMSRYGVSEGDLEGIVNYALSIRGIEFAILLKEKQDFVKLSFRSKKDFSVNNFAREHFEGGGHFNAAGGRSYLSMTETIKKLENLLDEVVV